VAPCSRASRLRSLPPATVGKTRGVVAPFQRGSKRPPRIAPAPGGWLVVLAVGPIEPGNDAEPGALNVEHRFAPAIADGMVAAGLRVE
jgi:hypothetical protein